MCNLSMIPESELIEIKIIPTHTEVELKLEDAEEFNYENQFNLPKINGNELKGDKTGTELGLVNLEDYNEYKTQVNGELMQQFDALTDLNNSITQNYQDLTGDIDDLSLLVETNTQNITNLNEEIEITSSNLEALTGDVENISGELDSKISRVEAEHLISQIQQFKHEIVDILPIAGNTSTMYLVPKQDNPDVYEEYIWLEDSQKYEDIGSTAIDLSEYAKLTDIPTNFVNTTQLVTLSTQTARYDLSNVSSNIDYVISEQVYGGGESGKRKWKNGRFEQWGVATTSDAGEVEFTIHEAFRDMLFSVFVEPREKGNFFHYAYPSAVRKFKTRIADMTGTPRAIKIQWKAEGYWK